MQVHTQLPESLRHRFRLIRGEGKGFQLERKIKVAHDGGDIARKESHVAVVLQVFQLLALQLVQILVDALHAAESLEQLRGGLLPDTGNAGDIVGRVAHQAQEIGDLRGSHPVFFLDHRRIEHHHVANALLRGEDARVFARQLAGVLVAGHQQDIAAERFRPCGDGTQDIVAFPTRHLNHRDVHRLEQVLDKRELHAQVIVHRRALGLVFFHRLDAERGFACIERAYDSVRGRHIDEFQEHGKEAEDGVGRRAIRRIHGRGHRMVRAMHQRITVDNCYGLGHVRRLLSNPFNLSKYSKAESIAPPVREDAIAPSPFRDCMQRRPRRGAHPHINSILAARAS